MLLVFGYLYKFVTFYFLSFFQKTENNRLKKTLGQNFVTLFFLFKIGSVGPVDQQIRIGRHIPAKTYLFKANNRNT